MDRRLSFGTGKLSNYATYSYDGTGKRLPTISKDTFWTGSTPTAITTTDSFVYNGSGKITERVKSQTVMSFTGFSGRNMYTYDGSGKLIMDVTQTYSSSTWKDDTRDTYGWDGSGNLIYHLNEDYNSGSSSWDLKQRDSFYYAGGKQSGYRNYKWNGTTWEGDQSQDFNYTGNNITEVIEKEWNGLIWVNSSRSTVTWDSNNKPQQALEYKWTGTAYETNPSGRVIWVSSTGTSVKEVAGIQTLNVFPNPATHYLTISFGTTTNANVHYSLVDLTGRSVMSGSEKVTGDKMTLNNLELSKGIYYMLIDCNGSTHRTKVVIE